MSTYTVEIPGLRPITTSVISTPTELKSGLNTLLSSVNYGEHARRVVGLDIEQANDEIDLLKLATISRCLLIQLRRFSREILPSELSRFLQLPDISFVGVGIKYSVEALERSYKIRCRNAIDLGVLVASYKEDKKLQFCGLVDLVVSLCGNCGVYVKSPNVAFSDWNANVLNKEQIEAATSDVYRVCRIGKTYLGGLGLIDFDF